MWTRRRILKVAGLVAAGLIATAWYFRPQPYHTIRNADAITLYEGLPHPMYEEEAYQRESKGGSTIEWAGFPFYREPLEPTPADAEALRSLLGDDRAYKAYSGEKKCGRYHPDYAVEWTTVQGTFRALICFGCFEARLQLPDGSQRWYDLHREGPRAADSRLMTLLKKYRKSRPYHEFYGPLGHRPPGPPFGTRGRIGDGGRCDAMSIRQLSYAMVVIGDDSPVI